MSERDAQANSPEERGEAVAELRRWFADTTRATASMLRWHRCVGYARHDGVSVDMIEPPVLAGDDIEYIGGVGRIDGRDMTPDEMQTVHLLLVRMREAACDALQGTSTLVVVEGNKP